MSTAKFPLGTIIAYGPDDKLATKLAVAVFKRPGQKDPDELRRWFSSATDVRNDPAVAREVAGFLKQHGVQEAVTSKGILGCPHEEGIDYPVGGTCPLCPFWANRDRFASEEPISAPALAPETFPPGLVLAQLSAVRPTQPINALAAADSHRGVLTEDFLGAIERGLADPEKSFENEGMLFNYASYFLAKWREPRAYPLFIRWFSLPGEGALELGGDTVTQHGARLLASVCGADTGPVKELILNRAAHADCRAQAVKALALLAAWCQQPREATESYFAFLAREGLERQKSQVWNELGQSSVQIEALTAFPELRRAYGEGLIDATFLPPERLDEVERAPRGATFRAFGEGQPRITDVAAETRWWAGFHPEAAAASAEGGESGSGGGASDGTTGAAAAKVGRNDACPCGSGKKYKKCCGK